MRVLYFDLDGTLIESGFGRAKARLREGAFERAVREASFEKIVCVGNAVAIIEALRDLKMDPGGKEMILELCDGAFMDEGWFRGICSWVPDPKQRTRYIDLAQDWWYADDLAERYFDRAGSVEVFQRNLRDRILVPDPEGDGGDVLAWLNRVSRDGK